MENPRDLQDALAQVEMGMVSAAGSKLFLAAASAFEDEKDVRLLVAARLAELEREIAGRGLALDVPETLRRRIFAPPTERDARRIGEWVRSRAALVDALSRALEEGASLVGFSLSHTNGLGVAAVRASVQIAGDARIGIDVERANRAVSSRTKLRMAHPDDLVEPSDPIALWTLKEAIFKTGRLGSAAFSEIVVRMPVSTDRVRIGEARCRGQSFQVSLAEAEGFLIAAAVPG